MNIDKNVIGKRIYNYLRYITYFYPSSAVFKSLIIFLHVLWYSFVRFHFNLIILLKKSLQNKGHISIPHSQLFSCVIFRPILLEEPPRGDLVHTGAVYRHRELRYQDGAGTHANPGQQDRGVRVRILYRRRVQREIQTNALYRVHAHSLRSLPAKETGHSGLIIHINIWLSFIYQFNIVLMI